MCISFKLLNSFKKSKLSKSLSILSDVTLKDVGQMHSLYNREH